MHTPNGNYSVSQRKLHEKVLGLQLAGKTEREISQILAISPLTIRYLDTLFKTSETIEPLLLSVTVEQRPELAHELWKAGKSFAEIGKMLQISSVRARQMIHRYAWILRHHELRNNRKH